ncbi:MULTISPECIES: hypothetical protein [unclassified Rhodanobacter]|uniref:Glycoside hydrolase family 42 N-terminal domain-containing protein n=1 Tax=Rhodanobacter humi TaxID=1888173 RepID=A0ABV4ARI5_9GAMM
MNLLSLRSLNAGTARLLLYLVAILMLGVASQVAHATTATNWKFPDKLRAVHFWQPWIDTNPSGSKGAWLEYSLSGLDLQRADSELKMVSEQGFNTVVLWVPWGNIMSSVNYVDSSPSSMTYVFDSNNEAKLQGFVQSAAHYGLSVVLMPLTAANPTLYHDNGVTPSTRVCSTNFNVFYNPAGNGAPCTWSSNLVYALFTDTNLFDAYNAFLVELSRAVAGMGNVYGFIIPWETDNAPQGQITVSQVTSMANSLKAYDKTKAVAYYPRPGDPSAMYYIAGTDFVAMGWYGAGSGAMPLPLADDTAYVVSMSRQAQPVGAPPMKVFIYEFAYDAHTVCENFDVKGGCSTAAKHDPTSGADQPVAGWDTRGEMWQDIFVGYQSSTWKDIGVVNQMESNSNLLGYSYWGLYDADPYSPLCDPSTATQDYYSTWGFGLIKLVPTQASQTATTCQAFVNANLSGFTEKPRAAWNTFGRILKTPQIDALGLGCANDQCIWITGERFAGQFEDASIFPSTCHVDFYTPDWSAPGFLQTVVPDYCDDRGITLTIPSSILQKYRAVNVTVVNKYGMWSVPKLISLSAP